MESQLFWLRTKTLTKSNLLQSKTHSKLSDAEIEEMIKDAEKNREADAKRAEEISTIIQAENLVNSLEKEMNEGNIVIPEEEKTKIAEYIKEVKELINNKDVEQLKKKIDELNVAYNMAKSALQDKQPIQRFKVNIIINSNFVWVK